MGNFEIAPESASKAPRGMDRFHLISWILAVGIPVGLALTAEIVAPPARERPATAQDWALGIVLVLIFFNVLYWIYDKHVNRLEPPGCLLQLLFFGTTGLLGGVILVFAWDLLRWIQYRVMRPPGHINFCTSTPGFLYSGRVAQHTNERT